MEKKIIKIDNQEVINYLEGLNYEVESRKNLLDFIIRNGTPDSQAFKDYHKEYVDFFTKYEMAKQEFAKEYVYPVMNSDKNNTNWNLDFYTHECTIEVIDK